MRVLFLSSGGGSTARFLYKLSQLSNFRFIREVEISILADRDCGAYRWAKSKGLNAEKIDMQSSVKEITDNINNFNAEIIVTTIYKIIQEEVIIGCAGKMINLHYSLLPAFAGTIGDKSIKDAVSYGCMLAGSTCHMVTREVDGGQPISQVAYCTENKDIVTVKQKAFVSGCLALYSGLYSIKRINYRLEEELDQVITISGGAMLCSPGLPSEQSLTSEIFWNSIQKD